MRHIVKKRGKGAAAFEIQMCWILKLMYVFIHLRAASMCACIYILSAAMRRCAGGLWAVLLFCLPAAAEERRLDVVQTCTLLHACTDLLERHRGPGGGGCRAMQRGRIDQGMKTWSILWWDERLKRLFSDFPAESFSIKLQKTATFGCKRAVWVRLVLIQTS